jgi:4'-phosphopantetheinyl transferase
MDLTDTETPLSAQWQPPPPHPWLGPDDVHIWRAHFEDPRQIRVLREMLTLSETVQAEWFADPADCQGFIAARGFLRAVLAQYGRCAPTAVPLEKGVPPRLGAPMEELKCDAAQSGHLTLVAVSRGTIGLDLERIHEKLPFAEMATHYFQPETTWEIVTARGFKRAAIFFRTWTREEAARRAGAGSAPFTGNAPLALRQFTPEPGFAAALAAPSGFRLACWDWQLAA